MFIPDPDLDFFTHPGSRIQASKRNRIPDQDPQHWPVNRVALEENCSCIVVIDLYKCSASVPSLEHAYLYKRGKMRRLCFRI
jgi:hypothetical protein